MTIPPEARVKIRAEMSRCGYTLDTLCAETQISQIVLRGILYGSAQSISTRNLFSLSRAFGYEVSNFVDLLSGAASYPNTNQD